MKRNFCYPRRSSNYWNKLVKKYLSVYKKIKELLIIKNSSIFEIKKLLDKLNKLYKRLKQLRVRAGIKIAGTALALMLTTATINAQEFASFGFLKKNAADIDVISYSDPEFADIDNDGDLDLFIGNLYGYVEYYKNDGYGNFTSAGRIKENGSNDKLVSLYSSPAFEDIDSDGDLDLYVGGFYKYINVFTNNGSGAFSTGYNLQADSVDIDIGYSMSPEFADIDNDGDLDLYVGYTYGTIKVYLNNGSGVFTDAGYLQQAGGANIDVGNRSHPAFADIDNDGDLDLYVGNQFGNINVFSNNGNGVFTSAGYMQANSSTIDIGDFSTPTFADIDEDGDLDLYVGNKAGVIEIFINDGFGNFSAAGNIKAQASDIVTNNYSSPEFADLDNNNAMDLYVGDFTGNVSVFTNDGFGNFAANGYLQVGGSNINPGICSSPAFADIDNDNDLDLYLGYQGGYIKVYKNNGSGIFTEFGNLQADSADINVGTYSSPAFADLDNDGDLDIYVGNYDGYIKIFINNSGDFTSAGNLQADSADIDVWKWATPVFKDIDNDGDFDLFVGTGYGYVIMFTNDGFGNLTEVGKVKANDVDIDLSNRTRPNFADIDNDGDLDLYLGAYEGKINIFKNITIPDIISQPTNLSNSCPNSLVSCIVKANFANSYQWQVSSDTGVNFSDIADNATYFNSQTDTLLISSNATLLNYQYRCIVSNSNGKDTSDVTIMNFDALDPILSVQDMTVYTDSTGNASITANDVILSATDNCTLVDTTLSVSNFDCSDIGNIVDLEITLTDESGNYTVDTAHVTVLDTIAPKLVVQNITAYINEFGSLNIATEDLVLEAWDNCTLSDTTLDINNFDCSNLGVNNVDVTLTDNSGNSTVETVEITILDTIAPSISCISSTTVTADSTHYYTIAGTEFDPESTSDNCGIASIINDFNSSATLDGALLQQGTITIVWTITDNSGNTNTCSFSVTIKGIDAINSINTTKVSIFPNPTTGIINIESESKIESISITDVTGKEILRSDVTSNVSLIDFSDYSKGIYFIKIKTEQGIVTKKIIKD